MSEPLNILFLQGEDLGLHLGCYGDFTVPTPNLDQLAREGARYTNAFTHAPVCAPSRGGMVSGRYPYSLGNHHMRSTLATPPRTFTQELRDAGYYVNWNTKLDFNFDPQPEWRDAASAWYESPAPTEPFFLYENIGLTHESCMFPKGRDGKYDPDSEDLRLDLSVESDFPLPPHLADCPELREQLLKYYRAVAKLDHLVGERLRWLDEQGLRERTLVVFLSDHGRGLPREKRWCYEAGMHLPLIIRWPGKIVPGSRVDALVGWVDIAPTLLSLAGVPVPESYQGQVFLGPDRATPRECVFGGRDRMDEVFDRVRMVRDTRWHYIRNFAPKLPQAQCQTYMEQQEVMGVMRARFRQGQLQGAQQLFFSEEKPEEELYDIAADPHCLHNLADDPSHSKVLDRMRARLATHLQSVRDLGEISEEDLIERGILTNRLPEYRDRRDKSPRERVLGSFPYPMTLREAQAAGKV